MEDKAIVALYWQRDEAAIRETDDRYGDCLLALARRILADEGDSVESVNDTYLKAWNSIPPHRPDNLRTYLCRIARQTAIDRLRRRLAQKRADSEYCLSLDELAECVAASDSPCAEAERRVLAQAVNAFVRTLEPREREVFLRRYFYFESLREIAARRGDSVAAVKSSLFRMRQRLRAYLEKEELIG